MFERATKPIDLNTPVSLASSFRFPLQSTTARREVVVGALLLLIPVIGWLLNMGHRIQMVHNMMQGDSAWPAWTDYPGLFKHGLITFGGMVYYYLPALGLGLVSQLYGSSLVAVVAVVLFLLATIAIPGYMSHYCREFDVREIFNPVLAASRVFESGSAYWRAWLIALTALALSFSGLLLLGIGFLFTSVWFWQVAGYSFAATMTQQHTLMKAPQDQVDRHTL